MEKDIYVLVAERDTYEPQADSHPIVFEQYIDKGSLKNAIAFKERLGDKYGKIRIAKLQFVE